MPEVDETITEIHQLSNAQYKKINDSTLHLAQFISGYYSPEKINTGNIGNMVRQMHIHVVDRTVDDPAWPGVVWACSDKQAYQPEEVSSILAAYTEFTSRL